MLVARHGDRAFPDRMVVSRVFLLRALKIEICRRHGAMYQIGSSEARSSDAGHMALMAVLPGSV
jgi:hypothetical protein